MEPSKELILVFEAQLVSGLGNIDEPDKTLTILTSYIPPFSSL